MISVKQLAAPWYVAAARGNIPAGTAVSIAYYAQGTATPIWTEARTWAVGDGTGTDLLCLKAPDVRRVFGSAADAARVDHAG